MGEEIQAYWKRFGASATGYVHKYRFDPFFRTEVSVVALQIVFAVLLLLIVGLAATSLYHDASAALSRGIEQVLTSPSNPEAVGHSVAEELSTMRMRTVTWAAIAVVAVTVFLSYLIARVALSPTRNALESQKQFIGNVAHELRTPLSVIKTNTEVALMSGGIERELRSTLESTVGELDRISEIINNLLSLSASVRPERMEFKDLDFGPIVHGVIGKLKELADSKRVEITARMSQRRFVLGNPAALEQITMNILKNAITYSPRGGRVIVTVEPIHPDYIEFTVQDFGIGIAQKNLFRIFEPYYRVDPSRYRGESGSGLGLTIVSELVKLHNGKITVRSAEQRGTIVTVHLPAGRPSLTSERAAAHDEHAGEVTVDFSHRAG
ncbi:HAMP domain-containing histidine kinase [Candidatus Kaiserbacteria bacterium]|nr:HAMP domain-containing histidine kinase [Candidatus Kaiserbacteria bacterium]